MAVLDADTGKMKRYWDIAFSKDPQQRYIFLADGTNEKARIVLRETFVFKGIGTVASGDQGALWPRPK